MKIAFLDILGLSYDATTVDKRGIGGSESAVVYLSQELNKLGFDITVFNNCENEGTYNNIRYFDVSKIQGNDEEFDILLVSRTPIPFVPIEFRDTVLKNTNHDIARFKKLVDNSKYKVLWMHDNFVLGEEWLEDLLVDGYYDEIFTLSDWHSQYVPNARHNQPIRHFEAMKRKIFQTRNGVRNFGNDVNIDEKDPNLFVYNASITKGMVPLLDTIWPKVNEEFPEAKLVVIGGYYSNRGAVDSVEMLWRDKRSKHDGKRNVLFTGIVTQKEISDIMKKASFFIYPGAFPETFGIAATEAINYNVPLITTRFGALEETAPESTSYLIDFPITRGLQNYNTEGSVADPGQAERFLNAVRLAYTDEKLKRSKMLAANEFKPFLGWDTVALQWKHHFFHKFGKFMPVEELREKIYRTNRLNSLYNRRFLNEEDKFEDYSGYEKRDIIVVTHAHNSGYRIRDNILSVSSQLYGNYHQIIIDDASDDQTYDIAVDTLSSFPLEMRQGFTVIKNSSRKGELTNQIHALDNISGDAIVLLLNGDDCLVNDPYIFEFINREYARGAKMTYGSSVSSLGERLISREFSSHEHYSKSYRNNPISNAKPITFDLGLYESIRDDLSGETQESFLYPLLERCDKNSMRCLQRVVSKVSGDNAESRPSDIVEVLNSDDEVSGSIPTKAYIIRNSENQHSIEYSLSAAESCQKIGLPYEFVEGFYYKTPDELWFNSDIVTDYRREMIKPDASCNASHFKVWEKIRDNRETAVILEHDGIMLQPIDIPIPDDKIVVLGYKASDPSSYDHIKAGKPKHIRDIERHFGCHAYAMTHKTAEFLLDELKNEMRMTTSVDSTYFIRFKHNSNVPSVSIRDLKDSKSVSNVKKIYILRDAADKNSNHRIGLLLPSCNKTRLPVEVYDVNHGPGSFELWEDKKFGIKSYCTEMVPRDATTLTAHITMWKKIRDSGEAAIIIEDTADPLSRYFYNIPDGSLVTIDNNNNNKAYALTSKTAAMLLDELGTLNVWDSIDMIYFNKRKMTSSVGLAIMDPTPAIGWVRKSTVWSQSWVENTPFLKSFSDNLIRPIEDENVPVRSNAEVDGK